MKDQHDHDTIDWINHTKHDLPMPFLTWLYEVADKAGCELANNIYREVHELQNILQRQIEKNMQLNGGTDRKQLLNLLAIEKRKNTMLVDAVAIRESDIEALSLDIDHLKKQLDEANRINRVFHISQGC